MTGPSACLQGAHIAAKKPVVESDDFRGSAPVGAQEKDIMSVETCRMSRNEPDDAGWAASSRS